MMALDVTTQHAFSVGKPSLLFEGQCLSVQVGLTNTAYEVSPGGQRFWMVKETSERFPTRSKTCAIAIFAGSRCRGKCGSYVLAAEKRKEMEDNV